MLHEYLLHEIDDGLRQHPPVGRAGGRGKGGREGWRDDGKEGEGRREGGMMGGKEKEGEGRRKGGGREGG